MANQGRDKSLTLSHYYPKNRLLQKKLLLLLQLIHHLPRDLEGARHDIRWGESQPLRQRDVSHALGLVQLDPHQVLGGRGVKDVVAGVVGEDGDVSGDEVDGARVAAADKDGCLRRALVEIEPLLSL